MPNWLMDWFKSLDENKRERIIRFFLKITGFSIKLKISNDKDLGMEVMFGVPSFVKIHFFFFSLF